jgi:hypothetical protein
MSDELQELHEHAEHARHDPSAAPVSLTMAILAVLVASVSLLGHRAHTEEVVLQNKVTDQWAEFQAKSIRRHTDEMVVDILSVLGPKQDPGTVSEKYKSEMDRYRDEQKDLSEKARDLESETLRERNRADRFDLGEVFLEIALVVSSITLLSGRRMFWYAGLVCAALGTVVAATGFLLH